LISPKNIFCRSGRSVHQHVSGCLLVSHDVHGLDASVSSSHVATAAAADTASITRVACGGEGRGSCGSRGARARTRRGSAPDGHGEAFAVALASAMPAWGACTGFTCRVRVRPVVRWRRRLRGGALRHVAARRRRLLPMAARPPGLPPLRVASSSTVPVTASSPRNGAATALPYSSAPHCPIPLDGRPAHQGPATMETAFPPPPPASLPRVTQRRWKKNGGEEREYAEMSCSLRHRRFPTSACTIHRKDE
jgi:hypothetical protein